jgi:hypothetical protein
MGVADRLGALPFQLTNCLCTLAIREYFRGNLHNQGLADWGFLANRTCKSSKAVLATTLMGDNQRTTTNLVINRVSIDLDPNFHLLAAERMLRRNFKALFQLIFECF